MADTLHIHDLAPLGDGIHQSETGRVYVDRALPGDVVRVRTRREGGLLRGDVLELLEASPHRIKAPCVHYDVCGGCTLQHAEQSFYRDWKVETVRRALHKQGVTPETWRDTVFLPESKRRRVTFAALKKRAVVTLGYFRRRSHHVTEITDCLVADPAILAMRVKLRTDLAPLLMEGKGADIFIQSVNGHGEVVMTGAIGRKGFPDLQAHEAFAHIAQTLNIARISWRSRAHDRPETMVERYPLTASFGVLNVPLPPLAFLQPTEAGERALVDAVLELLPQSGRTADLFSGCGTFAGSFLKRGSVDAYENAADAVTALDRAKGAAPLQVFRRDLYHDPLRADEAARYDAIVFDPPRAGAEEQAKALAGGKVPLIIGVSCNPITFARDARILTEGGYRLESVKIIDQFTWTHHVELVAAFKRTI